MSQERAEWAGTGRDRRGRGGIPIPKHSGRLRGKGAILLGVSHRPARFRFPPPPLFLPVVLAVTGVYVLAAEQLKKRFCSWDGWGTLWIHPRAECVMAYMLLIMEEGGRKQSRTAEQGRREMERMVRFVEDLKARGVWKASDSLRSASEGVRIEVRGGQRTLRDGPFTESKEIVGGFILLDCHTRAEALAIASECPAAEWSTVELREIGVCYDGD